jgi:hypothetical protein
MNDKIKWFGRYLGSNMIHVTRTLNPKTESIREVTPLSIHAMLNEDQKKLILKELKNISEDELRIILLELKIDCFIRQNPTCNFHEAKKYILRIMSGVIKQDAPNIIEFSDCFRSHGFAIGIPKEYYITELELKEAK